MKRRATAAKTPLPYIYDYFNVSCFTSSPNSLTTDILTRIMNCFIKALNDALKLPRLVVVIQDWDLLQFVNYFTKGVRAVNNEAVKWVINHMIRAVDAKIDNLVCSKPGSIIYNEPKFIWIKMMHRLNATCPVLAFNTNFNDVLENTLAGKSNHFLMDVDAAMSDTSMFDIRNFHLNDYGGPEFWLKVDKQIEKFEKKRISLRPAAHTISSTTQPDKYGHTISESARFKSTHSPRHHRRPRHRTYHRGDSQPKSDYNNSHF